MTLHEAIKMLLLQVSRPMTTTEIADALNRNKWYQKKDFSPITPYQIHSRISNYPHLFNRNGSTVSLIGQPIVKISIPIRLTHKANQTVEISNDNIILEKILMNEKNFKSAAIIDNLLPNHSGLYCIRINDINALPKAYNNILKERNHNIIYIGIASHSLSKRFLNQELRANGHGTFFRSMGAILGYRPAIGSLKNKANKRNYTFNPSDEIKIIEWINKNLIVNWIKFKGEIEAFETQLIQRYLPLVNIDKNPVALQIIKDLRAECVRIANGR